MSDSQEKSKFGTPWHLWCVGIFALLWSGMGALDYLMTQTQNASYMSNYSAEQLTFFYGLPSWIIASWAIGVWGGILGALLLLMRKQLAAWVFLASLICMVTTTIQNYVFSNGMEVMRDAFSLAFTATIFLFALGFFLYSIKMRKQGVLL
ncbi:MAG: hypothetical protein ACI9SC_002070 [Gammaproteobacteria bacterium]|jgi:hypothetical protein